MVGSISMEPALAPRRRGTASATKRSWDVNSLKKAWVVEEEKEVMGWGWLKIFLFVELIDRG